MAQSVRPGCLTAPSTRNAAVNCERPSRSCVQWRDADTRQHLLASLLAADAAASGCGDESHRSRGRHFTFSPYVGRGREQQVQAQPAGACAPRRWRCWSVLHDACVVVVPISAIRFSAYFVHTITVLIGTVHGRRGRGQGVEGTCPPTKKNFGNKYFSGNYYVNSGIFRAKIMWNSEILLTFGANVIKIRVFC